jgi:hypothetical protein
MSTNVSSSGGKSRQSLRLFCLRYGKYGPQVLDTKGHLVTFDDKMRAKQTRDRLNAGLNPPVFVVSHGPDHR